MFKSFFKGFILIITVNLIVGLLVFVITNTAVASETYSVGAFYFSEWNTDFYGDSRMKNGEYVYGRNQDVWNGVRDHLSQPGPWVYGPFPDREPLVRWYDDSRQSVMDQQILQASSRGLDHFSFYYYWNGLGGYEVPGQNVYNFQSSVHKDLMHFYICFVADGVWPASDWDNYIIPKLITFMQDPSYKRTTDGRPIISFFGDFMSHFGGSESQTNAALQRLRAAAQNAGLPLPRCVVNSTEQTIQTFINQGFDGFLPLNLAGLGLAIGVPDDYNVYPPAWNTYSGNFTNYFFIPGQCCGFDPRGWRDAGYAPYGVGIYQYINPQPNKFRAQAQYVKNYLDTHPSSLNMATFYAWNENGEGGVIEPTTLFGYGYLNALQEVFGLSNTAYKQRVARDGLTDLDPDLRLEFAPDIPYVTSGQSFNIPVKITNKYQSTITSGNVSLDTAGWTITNATGTNLAGLAAGASQNANFTVTASSIGTSWTKHLLTVTADYTVSAQNKVDTGTTFVVKADDIYGAVEAFDKPVVQGSKNDLKVTVRNYSLTAGTNVSYQIFLPSGWYMTDNGYGVIPNLAANTTVTSMHELKIPNNIEPGTYNIRMVTTSNGTDIVSDTAVNVGNLVFNGGFERDADFDSLSDSWLKISAGTTLTRSTINKAEGTYSQKISATGIGNGIKQEWFEDIQANQSYIVKAWIKVESGSIKFYEGEATDRLASYLGENASQTVSSNVWQEYTLKFKPLPNAKNVSIRFETNSNNSNVAYIDKVTFMVDTDGSQLINDSFEIDADSNGIPDNWNSLGTATLQLDSSTAAVGTKSEKITASGYGNGIRQEWINIDSTKSYVLEFWAKVNSGTIALTDGELTGGGGWSDYNVIYTVSMANNGNTWQKYTAKFTPKSDTSQISVRLLSWADGQTVANVDGIVLKEAPVNFILNSDFESCYMTNGLQQRWISMGTPVLTKATDCMVGEYAQQVSGTGFENGVKQEWIDFYGADPIVVDFWAKVISGTLAVKDVECQSDYTLLGENLNVQLTNPTWTKYTFVIAPKNNAAKYSIRFCTGSSGANNFIIDDVTVRPARSDDLLANKGFEQDIDTDGIGDLWSKMGNCSVSRNTTDKIEGNCSQEVLSSNYGNGIAQEWIYVTPNTAYQLTVNTKVNSGQMAVIIGEASIKYYTWLGQTTLQTIDVSGWTSRTWTFTTNASGGLLSIRYLSWNTGNTDGLIDNVSLRKLGTY